MITDDTFNRIGLNIANSILDKLESNPETLVENGILIITSNDEEQEEIEDYGVVTIPLETHNPNEISLVGSLMADQMYPEKIEAAFSIREGFLFELSEISPQEVLDLMKQNVDLTEIKGNTFCVSVYGQTLDARNNMHSILYEDDDQFSLRESPFSPDDPYEGEAPLLHAFITAYAKKYMDISSREEE